MKARNPSISNIKQTKSGSWTFKIKEKKKKSKMGVTKVQF